MECALLRGAASFWTAACGLAQQARVGISVRQEEDLSFVVDGIAPGSNADTSSLLQLGDRIEQVEDTPCIQTDGLTEDDLRRLREHVKNANEANLDDHDEECIRTAGGAASLCFATLSSLPVTLRSETSM